MNGNQFANPCELEVAARLRGRTAAVHVAAVHEPRGAQPGHVRAGQLPGHLVARAGAEPADELRYASSWLVL